MAIVELYLRAERSGHAAFQYSVAGLLFALALATAAGSAAAIAFVWWPRLLP